MERFWTVEDVMELLPYGKTKATAIVNSLPHIGENGDKKLIEPRYIREWIEKNTRTCGTTNAVPTAQKKPRPRKVEGLTEDGLIPYRHTKKTG